MENTRERIKRLYKKNPDIDNMWKKYYPFEPVYDPAKEDEILRLIEEAQKKGELEKPIQFIDLDLSDRLYAEWEHRALTGTKVRTYRVKGKEHYEEMCNFSGE